MIKTAASAPFHLLAFASSFPKRLSLFYWFSNAAANPFVDNSLLEYNEFVLSEKNCYWRSASQGRDGCSLWMAQSMEQTLFSILSHHLTLQLGLWSVQRWRESINTDNNMSSDLWRNSVLRIYLLYIHFSASTQSSQFLVSQPLVDPTMVAPQDIPIARNGSFRRVSSSLSVSTSPTATFHSLKHSFPGATTTRPVSSKHLKPFATEDIKVLLLENINKTGQDCLSQEGYQVESLKTSLSEDQLIEKIRSVDFGW